ncbi:putative conserved tandem protein 12 [Amphidinium carterae]|mmetsp:Transcript_49815/g.116429  ORF Transcript_49815/g.116429 Transcript_49815/m.116429 type:complete len:677 (+) Transcript_49815:93-2123(+)
MQFRRAYVAVGFLALLSVPAAHAENVTPVQKVIEMLTGMKSKGEAEKHEETVQFATYKQFCDDTSATKTSAIAEANDKIDMLKADIQKYAANSEHLAKEIAGHDADIAAWTGDQKAATTVRQLEVADFQALHTDYSESVDALQRAILILQKQAHDRKQASSLTQVQALTDLKLIPVEAKRAIDLFVQTGADPLEVTAPEANAYEFQSQGIVDMLQKLLDKFIEEKTDLEKQESNSLHAYQILMQDLTSEIDYATETRANKMAAKASALQAAADSEGTLTDTTTSRDEDKKYLADLVSTCEQKASDFEARQKLRAEELEALAKAVEILSSEAVSGNAEKYLPQLLQKKAKSVLAQLRTEKPTPLVAHSHLVQYLQQQAKKLNSRVLSALAVRAGSDPFDKVKKLIKDLIVRLMEEANEEAEHKGWCDTELGTNEQTRKLKTETVELLHAHIDELEASTNKLANDITEHTAAVAQLTEDMAKATEFRQKEKATNAKTIADADEAETAVAQALLILKEFYAKAAEATALVQQSQQPTPPPIFDSPYQGMQAENGGIVGMLEVIQSDFARLSAETDAAESVAQKEYQEFMTDSEVNKAQNSKDIEHKTAKKQDHEQALVVKQSDLQGTQKELDAALAYYDKLKPSCVDAGVSYDDRVARRQEEIESLQEALRILNGEELA